MKGIIYSICIGSLALAVTAWGEQNDGRAKAKAQGKASPSTAAVQNRSYGRAAVNNGQVRTQQNFPAARLHQSTGVENRSAVVRQHTTNAGATRFLGPPERRNFNEVRSHNDVAISRGTNLNVNRERNFNLDRERNLALNRDRNVTINREQNFNVNRERNVTVNNNWRGQQFNGQNYDAFRNYHREWHDRDWWRSHHSRISFYFGAPYYWDAGYWYPAWGYYPDYVYQYDGPIYGYNGLAPDQVIVDVQRQLQRDGYYPGPIDGVLGPMTRRAIAAFQADHGLAITSAVDEPTLATLGLT
jgi:putative peptidoglycan binding protein